MTKRISYRLVLLNLLFCMVLPYGSQAQICDDFLTKVEEDNNIYTRENRQVSRKDIRKNMKAIEAEMLEDLKIKMAEKILTEVKTTSTSAVMESGELFEDFFNYESKVNATANLSYGQEAFCIDKENKVCYGVYSLDRPKTAQAILADCQNRMGILLTDVEQANEQDQTRNLDLYQSRSDRINKDARIASFLNSATPQDSLNSLYGAFQREFQQLQAKATTNNLKDQLLETQQLVLQSEYAKAITILNKLDIEFPNREEVKEALQNAELRFYAQTQKNISNFEALEQYNEALIELEAYCKVVLCKDNLIAAKDDLTLQYFNQEFDAFQKAINLGLHQKVGLHYQVLTQIASANPKGFDRAKRDLEAYEIESRMRKVEEDLNYGNYQAAFANVKNIQYEYSTTYGPLDNLRKRTENALFRYEVKKEKKTRRKLFAIAAGVEFISNTHTDFEEMDDLQTYSLAYSFGVYKKFNYRSNFRTHAGSSDIIGLKVRLIDFWNTYALPENDAPLPRYFNRYNTELMVDGTLFRFIHYGGGIIFVSNVAEEDLSYSGEFGLRLPVGPVSLQANLRFVSYSSETTYMFQAGIYGQFDFWRKFGTKDKQAIKKKYGL